MNATPFVTPFLTFTILIAFRLNTKNSNNNYECFRLIGKSHIIISIIDIGLTNNFIYHKFCV